jgi:hypothetical protein
MDACPHCQKTTISLWRKSAASSIRPVRCPSCRGLSYISGWAGALQILVLEVAFWSSVIAALVFRRWEFLLILPATFVSSGLVLGLLFSLKPTDAQKVQRARRWARVQLVGLFVFAVGGYWLFGSA